MKARYGMASAVLVAVVAVGSWGRVQRAPSTSGRDDVRAGGASDIAASTAGGQAATAGTRVAPDGSVAFVTAGADHVAQVGEAGVRFAPRGGRALTLGARSVGRTGAVASALPPGGLPRSVRKPSGRTRVEVPRGAGVVEWFESTVRGVEHGLVIEERPAGAGTLEVALAVEGAKATASEAGATLEATGFTARYHEVVAIDARGRRLPASIQVADASTLLLAVDDVDAVYPLVVDPWLELAPTLAFESDWPSAQAGLRIANLGDVDGDGFEDLAVGASNYFVSSAGEGAVFIVPATPSGLSRTASVRLDTQLLDTYYARLGADVAAAGDVDGDGYRDLLVGAPDWTAGETSEGAVLLYRGGATGIAAAPSATFESGVVGADLGTAIVGDADFDGNGRPDFASLRMNPMGVSVHLHDGTGLPSTPTQELPSLDASWSPVSPTFGMFVAVLDVQGDGYDDLAVGDPAYDGFGVANGGAVSVYYGSASGLSTSPDATLAGGDADAYLGTVSRAGDVDGDGYDDLLVGCARFAADGSSPVHLVRGSATGLVAYQELFGATATFPTEQPSSRFGLVHGSLGDRDRDGYDDLFISAVWYDGAGSDAGRVYVYRGGPTGPSAPPTLGWTPNVTLPTSFGWGVAPFDANGDGWTDVVIGAPGLENGNSDEGGVYVVGATASLPSSNDTFGTSDHTAFVAQDTGDLDADGFDDVLVVRTTDPNPGDPAQVGSARVYRGGPAGVDGADSWVSFHGGTGLDSAIAADVNGDGFRDLVTTSDTGTINVHWGSATLPSTTPDVSTADTMSYGPPGACGGFGTGMTAGDFDGDGYDDIVISVGNYTNGEGSEGQARLYRGSPTGFDAATPDWTFETNQASACLVSVAEIGDIDGDGYVDLAAGGSGYDDIALGSNAGIVWVFLGGPAGLSASPAFTIGGKASLVSFGWRVARAGDVDRDGLSDFVVGAPNGTAPYVALHLGRRTGPPVEAFAYTVPVGVNFCGRTVAPAGDVDRDGFADFLAGCSNYSDGEASEGAVLLFRGGRNGGTGVPTVITENVAGERLGTSISALGDVDGDGVDDFAAGSSSFAIPASVRVYRGDTSAGVDDAVGLRMRQTQGAMPVQPMGLANAPSVDVVARVSPRGSLVRGRVVAMVGDVGDTDFTVETGAFVDLVGATEVSVTLPLPGHPARHRVRACIDYAAAGSNASALRTTCADLGRPGEALLLHVRSPLRARGTTCDVADGEVCASGHCVDGYCCDTACGGGVPGDCARCDGLGNGPPGTCSPDTELVTCRPVALVGGVPLPCDVEELCDGVSLECPADAFAPPTVECRPRTAALCDVADFCSGTAAACPPDGVATNGTVCRASAGVCDPDERCDGASSACPPDGFASQVVCRAAAGPCDVAESCSGTAAACPADAFAGASVSCRASAGVCDVAEQCDGTGAACPANDFVVDGTACDDGVVCTSTSACQLGVCASTLALDCSDGDPCTTDACAEPVGCTHVPVPACMPDSGTDAGPDAAAVGDAGADAGVPSPSASGCSCRVAGESGRGPGSPFAAFGLALVVAVLVRARRGASRPARLPRDGFTRPTP